VPPRTLLLVPPSEGKAAGGTGPPWGLLPTGFPALMPARAQVLAAVAGTVRPSAAAAALTAAADGAPTLPALDRYTGVLYAALGVASLPRPLRRRADARVCVMSGLAGLLLGGDPVPDYKLPIGTPLPGLGGLGGLAAWWRPRLSPVLDEWVAGAVVWDLLPGAHAAAWLPGGSWRARWRVRVLREAASGARSTVSHDNKTAKGALARWVLDRSPRRPVDLVEWEGPGGYRVDLASSVYDARGGVVDLVRRDL